MRLCFLVFWVACGMFGQSAESIPFRALLSPRNLLPPNTTLAAEATLTIWLHVVRNADGTPASASVDWSGPFGFREAMTLTGLHIHQGNATQSGPVVVDAGLARQTATTGSVSLQAQVANAAALRNLIANPANFYVDLHTTALPGGALRAQLLPAERFVWFTPNGDTAVAMTATRDRLGRVTSAEVTIDAGGRAPVRRFEAPLEMAASIYNNTAGYVRADRAALPFLVDGTPSVVTAWSLRDQTGATTAGYLDFDLNYRFSGAATFEAPALIEPDGRTTALGTETVRSATGRGHFSASILAPTDSLLKAPGRFSVALNGVTARLGPAAMGAPEPSLAASGVWDPTLTSVARGGLITVFGRNVAAAAGGTTGLLAPRVPSSLNGTSVTIGGRAAPVLQVNTDAVVAQVPVEVALGAQPVVVTTPQGTGQTTAMVAAAAPGIYFDDITRDGHRAAVYRVQAGAYTQITSANPARPGDTLVLFGTGFGVAGVTPVVTGLIPTGISAAPRPVVTIGGRPAQVLYSLNPVGLPGLHQVALVMPAAAGAGPVPLVVRIGPATANQVYLDAAMR